MIRTISLLAPLLLVPLLATADDEAPRIPARQVIASGDYVVGERALRVRV